MVTRSVALLKERFEEEKVYVLGESWGSALGIWLVQRYPEDFHAFIGTGQMVAFLENDLMCYEFALDWARERGDSAKVEALTQTRPATLLRPRYSLEGSRLPHRYLCLHEPEFGHTR